MAASQSTVAHGVQVVTHIIPLEKSETIQHPSKKKELEEKPEVPYMTRMFLRGEPVALGTVQIIVGIVIMGLGAITLLTKTMDGRVSLGLGLAFVFTGSATLGAHKGTCSPLIKGSMVLNFISSLVGLMGVGFFCYLLTITPNLGECAAFDYFYNNDCKYMIWRLQNIIIGIKSLLLVFSMLEVCVCLTLVVFSCKAGCQVSKMEVEMVRGGEPVNFNSHEALLNTNVYSTAMEV